MGMVVFAKTNIIRVMLTVFIVFTVSSLFHSGPCYAENETNVSDDEAFVLPESQVLWTRDGNLAGSELTWVEAHDFLNNLNMKKFAGCERWRLPMQEEMTELLTFLDSGNADDEVVSHELDYYWVSASDVLEDGYADVVNMEDGSIDNCAKTESNYVWPVCDQ
jgi:hypothetical protein